MTLPCVLGLGAIAFTATFVLSFRDVVASENHTEDHRQLRECTQHGIARCYTYSMTVVPWDELKPNGKGEFNETAYRETCRVWKETSSCYEGSGRCPESMRSNFTRREEGYRAFRALLCGTDVFKVAMKIRHCMNFDKLEECIRNQTSTFNATGAEYEEMHCRFTLAQRVCYEKSWNSSCPISLEYPSEIYNKTLDATELLFDCKGMYPNATDATEGTRSKEVTLSDLAAEIAEMKALLRDNSQAIASLTEKVKKNSEILKHQVESSRRCPTHSDAPEISEA